MLGDVFNNLAVLLGYRPGRKGALLEERAEAVRRYSGDLRLGDTPPHTPSRTSPSRQVSEESGETNASLSTVDLSKPTPPPTEVISPDVYNPLDDSDDEADASAPESINWRRVFAIAAGVTAAAPLTVTMTGLGFNTFGRSAYLLGDTGYSPYPTFDEVCQRGGPWTYAGAIAIAFLAFLGQGPFNAGYAYSGVMRKDPPSRELKSWFLKVCKHIDQYGVFPVAMFLAGAPIAQLFYQAGLQVFDSEGYADQRKLEGWAELIPVMMALLSAGYPISKVVAMNLKTELPAFLMGLKLLVREGICRPISACCSGFYFGKEDLHAPLLSSGFSLKAEGSRGAFNRQLMESIYTAYQTAHLMREPRLMEGSYSIDPDPDHDTDAQIIAKLLLHFNDSKTEMLLKILLEKVLFSGGVALAWIGTRFFGVLHETKSVHGLANDFITGMCGFCGLDPEGMTTKTLAEVGGMGSHLMFLLLWGLLMRNALTRPATRLPYLGQEACKRFMKIIAGVIPGLALAGTTIPFNPDAVHIAGAITANAATAIAGNNDGRKFLPGLTQFSLFGCKPLDFLSLNVDKHFKLTQFRLTAIVEMLSSGTQKEAEKFFAEVNEALETLQAPSSVPGMRI